MREALTAAWRRAAGLPGIEQDALMYLIAAVFAGMTVLKAISADYRFWGASAGIAYLAAAALCGAVALRGRFGAGAGRARSRAGLVRRVAVLLLLLGAVLIPLVTELTWRADAHPGANAQPEVAVIERAGDRFAHHQNPYLRNPSTVGVSPNGDGQQIDATSYFPYLPGMVAFGLINASSGPPQLRDARVALAGFTLLVGMLALGYPGADLERRGRALQFLVVLPSGALAMVTGGDDLPVLAMMLVALLLAQRRRPVLAGFVAGLAATLKFTSWPLLVLLFFCVHDRENRRAPLRFGISALLVAGPVIGAGIASSPAAFIENVIRFPLGLASVKSPAASPLLGQVLVNLLPHEKRLITSTLVLLGAVIVLWTLRRWPPRSAGAVARMAAFAMGVATVLAPATRFGYLIYPVNLVVWGWLLDGMGLQEARVMQGQLGSSISYSVSDTVLVGVAAELPASAGDSDGAEGFTSTPMPQ